MISIMSRTISQGGGPLVLPRFDFFRKPIECAIKWVSQNRYCYLSTPTPSRSVPNKEGRIERMTKHWRKWYLLLRLHGINLNSSKTASKDMIGDSYVYIGLNRFLSDTAEKRLGLFVRSEQSQKTRMMRDGAIVDTCVTSTPSLIEKVSEMEIAKRSRLVVIARPDDKNWIRLTGDGDNASSFTVALNDFIRDNSYASKALNLIFLYLVTQIPIIRDLLTTLFPFFKHLSI